MNCHWLKKTQIIKDPNVEDYFVVLDPESSFSDYYEKHGDDFAKWYETGRVVVMDQVPIQINHDLLWKVTFPYGQRDLKKIDSKTILSSINNSDHALVRLFGKDRKLALEFQREVSRVSDALMQAAATLFPRYRQPGGAVTWRFSVTHTEGIHFDVYKVYKNHILRIFFNVDSWPRIWCLGDRSEVALSNLRVDKTWGDDPAAWNKRLTKEYGGDTFGYQPSSSPQHIVLFAPGSMWIVHSQYVSHGPIFGRRMVSMSIGIDPKMMVNPSLVFSKMPARLRRNRKEGS